MLRLLRQDKMIQSPRDKYFIFSWNMNYCSFHLSAYFSERNIFLCKLKENALLEPFINHAHITPTQALGLLFI
jgi:hypothetical protein